MPHSATKMLQPNDPLRLLNDIFGFENFRSGQKEIIDTIISGADVLAIMPTGAGKSLCYQLPALMRSGLTIVVSPLIALMRDQVAQLRNNGIEAGSLNSTNNDEENRRVRDALRDGSLRLLYASPERLASPEATEWLSRFTVNLLAIDEAHCVSQWGHDFRPEYALLGDVRRRLGNVQTVAFTATADEATRADIVNRLFENPPNMFVHGFDRPNIRLAMRAKENVRRQIRDFLESHRGESGIVYCATRDATDRMAANLTDDGFHTLPYHAGMSSEERARNQDIFLKEDGVIIAATVAFGMGIDKPDVRFVAHAAMPKSIEAYYQEIGRAGRDGEPADTLTLYGLDDMRLRRQQIDQSEAPDEQKLVDRQRMNALVALCEAPGCRRQTLLAYFNERIQPCGNCDLCQEGVSLFDGTEDAQKLMSAILRTGERFGTEHIINILIGEETEAVLKYGHQNLKTFGVGSNRSKNDWRSLVRQIYAAGLINLEIADYGRWSVTERGWLVLKGEERINLRVDVLQPKAPRKRQKFRAEAVSGVAEGDLLLNALKDLRRELARKQDVPAYVIFPDRTLYDIAAKKPKSLWEFADIHGVGQAKLDRFGEQFIAVVKDHIGT
ncbi:DNA helicase RecQ [Microvirga sp. W0021]|uniref:DNA helicase RecQ n=1 Tax=Hohaiivirga grylli TaxID=3133970 RepID=A0ABV0BIH2_9HYPH